MSGQNTEMLTDLREEQSKVDNMNDRKAFTWIGFHNKASVRFELGSI